MIKIRWVLIAMVSILLIQVHCANAAPEDARFSGGSYDGWARSLMTQSVSLQPSPPKGTLIIVQ